MYVANPIKEMYVAKIEQILRTAKKFEEKVCAIYHISQDNLS